MDKTIIVAILSSGAFTALINAIINYLNKKNEGKSNINKALMCLLGYELKSECQRLIKAKQVEFEDIEQLEELNKVYHLMGGNGYIKNLMDKVSKLEIKHKN